ncbi:hypothetical protein QR680_015046 [Steinernema hermaphroditum]|uniref:Uncharacterized protein n=1 Tax=Steinernema hermaphroditum TaxID=289476 RepID=A0AA39M5A3_9BILA|nr:hypothetical protein QR680_015046 [Steinernema hermaphroditum]
MFRSSFNGFRVLVGVVMSRKDPSINELADKDVPKDVSTHMSVQCVYVWSLLKAIGANDQQVEQGRRRPSSIGWNRPSKDKSDATSRNTCSSQRKKLIMLMLFNPGNVNLNSRTEQIILTIVRIAAGRQDQFEEVGVLLAPTDELSGLFIAHIVECFLNAPAWIAQYGLEHKFDMANFENRMACYLGSFKKQTKQKIVWYLCHQIC